MIQVHSSGEAPAAGDGGQESEVDALHRSCGVYTRPAVVKRILDSVGWKDDTDLSRARLLEPAAGNGQFVVEAVRRLVASCKALGVSLSVANLRGRILAFELHPGAASEAQSRTAALLRQLGVHHRTAATCAKAWTKNDDFLLSPATREEFTHIVGNPPYIRWSKIPEKLKEKYNGALPRDMTGGDLFLPFLDHALEQLRPDGHLGFLCSDRWRFMAFAEPFRQKWLPSLNVSTDEEISARDAFVSDVDSYPHILLATKRRKRITRQSARSCKGSKTLEELGFLVRVGPALGHSGAFVLETQESDVEPELLFPWIDGSEIAEGHLNWRGRRVVAMFDAGGLIDLSKFPRLARRLKRHASTLKQRSIVRNGSPWYRTIDCVRPEDWKRPKLVLPELAKPPRIAMDYTGMIPAHGVYAIFAPNDNIVPLYETLREGGLARGLEGIAPKVKGGYVRCYKRFLLKIQMEELL